MKIAFILVDTMLATSVTLPSEMLSAAQYHLRVTQRTNRQPLDIIQVGETIASVSCQTGMRITPDISIDQLDTADLIFLPALWRNPEKLIESNPKIIRQIKKLYEQGSILCGVGTGCCFMAEAGILDHKAATTHWHYFERFSKNYPKVKLQKHHFITQSHNCYCAASLNSLADLTVHIIKRFYNSHIAQKVERHFSHEIRKDYESMRFLENEENDHPDEDILQSQIYIQNNYMQTLDIEALAKFSQMSTRNFSRRFKQATGETPVNYLQRIRLEQARELLQLSNLSIIDIAYRTGFNNASYFNSIFKKKFSLTPKEYRISLRAKLFSIQKHNK